MAINPVAKYYAEIDVLCMILLVSLAIKTHTSNFISSHKRYFQKVLLSNVILAASDLVWIFNNSFLPLMEVFPTTGVVLSYILNGLNVIAMVVLGMTWLLFSEAVLGNYVIRSRWQMLLVSSPVTVITLLVLTTEETGFMFYVSPQGEFTRGVGYALQVAFSLGYILVSVVRAFSYARRAQSLQARQKANSVASFVIAPVCAGIAQLILKDMPVLFIGTVVGLLNVYISLQEQQVLTDPLTGLNNRRLLDQKIEAAIEKQSVKSELYLLVIDADNFKAINDKFGHIEGDRALQMIAEALKQNSVKEDFICRSGGDEFVMLHRCLPEEDCSQLIGGINASLAARELPYRLTVSVGQTHYSPEMGSWKKFLDAADEEMYRVKAEKKIAR